MRFITSLVVLPFLTTFGFAQEHRELDAHVHGLANLNIAIDGGQVQLQLQAPGADIVGFEHDPVTDEQRAMLAQALDVLKNPENVIAFPASARCEIEEAHVSLHREEQVGDHDEAHEGNDVQAHDEDHEHPEGHADETGSGHSAFEAEYLFSCAGASDLTSLTFPYFDQFPNGHEIHVQIVDGAGASSHEVTKEHAEIDLSDRM